MSFIFAAGDETVWSPALRAGQLYVGTLDTAARTLELPNGLIWNADDMYWLDLAPFEALVRRMLATYAESNHVVFRMLLGAVLPPSIVMLDRSGVALIGQTPDQQAYLDEVRDMDLQMAR